MIHSRRHRRKLASIVIVLALMALVPWIWRRPLQATTVANPTSEPTREVTTAGRDLPALRAAIRAEHAAMANGVQYGPVSADTIVVAVQVHRDATRLARLVAGLARVQDIQSALLVFSHGFYDDRINDIVRNVRFCRVIQLFYPYSLQLYPDSFPGLDPRDCGSPGADPEGCTLRDARLTEHKQHWWWKANYIFERLGGGVAARAPVLFLEEHHEVAPDALYMLRHAAQAQAAHPGAHVLALGRPPPARAAALPAGLLLLDAWRPPYHVGLAFNRTLWLKIAALSMHFCMYDDCSWSQSLLNVFTQFRAGGADMLACLWPRVVAGRAQSRPAAAWPRAFPQRVRVRSVRQARDRPARTPLPAGGWADARDQLFCLDPLLDVDGSGDDYLGLNDTLAT